MLAKWNRLQINELGLQANLSVDCARSGLIPVPTGIPEGQLRLAAEMLGSAKTAIILTARGPEQQSQGVNNVLAFINLASHAGVRP